MGIYIDILVGNDFKLHRHNLALTRHPGCRDNLVAERVNILHGLPIHQVGSALNLDHGPPGCGCGDGGAGGTGNGSCA